MKINFGIIKKLNLKKVIDFPKNKLREAWEKHQYRKDTISIGIRLISVSSGEILLAISTEKTIFSVRMNNNLFRFIDAGTNLLEVEAGYTENESVSYAVRKAIDQAILEMIKEGEKEGLWEFKLPNTSKGE